MTIAFELQTSANVPQFQVKLVTVNLFPVHVRASWEPTENKVHLLFWELGSLILRLSCVGRELGSLILRLLCVGRELGSLVLTINLRSGVYPRQWPPTHSFQKPLQKQPPTWPYFQPNQHNGMDSVETVYILRPLSNLPLTAMETI